MIRTPVRPSAALIVALFAAFAVVAGCEADRIPAAVACNSACEYADSCGEPACWDNCMASNGDFQVLTQCTSCLTAAADDCEWRARCLSSCDGRAIDNPECGGLCAGVAASCPGGGACMDACTAWDVQTRRQCVNCVEMQGADCEAWNQCDACHGGAQPAGDGETTTGDGTAASDGK